MSRMAILPCVPVLDFVSTENVDNVDPAPWEKDGVQCDGRDRAAASPELDSPSRRPPGQNDRLFNISIIGHSDNVVRASPAPSREIGAG